MARVEPSPSGAVFRGSLDSDDDLAEAARVASACGSYQRDDEDEDPLDGALSCFGCRYRRWIREGFTCMKDRLAPTT